MAGARTGWDAIRLEANDQVDGLMGTGPRKKWMKKEERMDELSVSHEIRGSLRGGEGGKEGWLVDSKKLTSRRGC